MHLLNVTSSLVFVCFCIFCGLLHSGFVFNKTETWFWYSKIKIQPNQKFYWRPFLSYEGLIFDPLLEKIVWLNFDPLEKYQSGSKSRPLVFDAKCSNVKLVYINSAFWIYMRLSINNLCEIDGIFVISLWYLCEIEKKVKRTYMYIGPKT